MDKPIIRINGEMKISVLVPVYGVEKYIEKCARSLFEQTYEKLEIIFVNDATRDRSIEILNRVLKDYPQRAQQTRIIKHERNMGLAMARRTAVSHATGEFIFHLDSDDYLEPDSIDNLVACIDNDNVDIVTGEYRRLLPRHSDTISQRSLRGKSAQEIAQMMISRQTPFNIWNRLYRRSLYDGLEIPKINNGEDYVTTNRLFMKAQEVRFCDKITYDYNRISIGNFKNNGKPSQRLDLERAAKFLAEYYMADAKCLEAVRLGALVGIASIALTCCDKKVLREIIIPDELKPYMQDYRLGKSRYVLALHRWRLYAVLIVIGKLYHYIG